MEKLENLVSNVIFFAFAGTVPYEIVKLANYQIKVSCLSYTSKIKDYIKKKR